MPKERVERLLTAFAVFCLALGIRLIGLGDALFYQFQEIFSLHAWDNHPLLPISGFLSNGALSIFYPLVELWKLLGGESLLWMRLLPALISAFSAVVFYLIIERKITRTTAILASLFYALNPLLIGSAQTLTPHPLAMLFILLSVWYATKWFASHGERGKFGTMAFALLAIYTHLVGLIYLAFLALAAVSTRLEPGFKRKYSYLPVFILFLLAIPFATNFISRITSYSLWVQDWWLFHQQYLYVQHGPNSIASFFLNLPFFTSSFSFMEFNPFIELSSSDLAFQYFLATSLVVFMAWIFLLGAWGGRRHPFMGLLFLVTVVPGLLIAMCSFSPYAYTTPFLPFGLACLAAGIGELSNKGRIGQVAAGVTTLIVIGLCIQTYLIEYAGDKNGMVLHQSKILERQKRVFRGEVVLIYNIDKIDASKIDQILKANLVKERFEKLGLRDLGTEVSVQRIMEIANKGKKIVLLDNFEDRKGSRYSKIAGRLEDELGNQLVVELEYPDQNGIYIFLAFPQPLDLNLYWYGSWPKSPRLPYLRGSW